MNQWQSTIVCDNDNHSEVWWPRIDLLGHSKHLPKESHYVDVQRIDPFKVPLEGSVDYSVANPSSNKRQPIDIYWLVGKSQMNGQYWPIDKWDWSNPPVVHCRNHNVWSAQFSVPDYTTIWCDARNGVSACVVQVINEVEMKLMAPWQWENRQGECLPMVSTGVEVHCFSSLEWSTRKAAM